MGLFRFRKKPDVLDLTKRYKKQQEKIEEMQSDNEKTNSQSQNAFSFLGNLASGSSSETPSEEYVNVSENVEEKKKKLAKRLLDITTKLEDLSNQIYHLQQRVELLEKKSSIGNY